MMHVRSLALSIFALGAFLSLSSLHAEAASYPDGSLLRQQDDERVYYIDEGQKRWVGSAEAFRIQGFRWESIVTVSSSELNSYATGADISTSSHIVMPGEDAILPDLVPFPLDDLRFDTLFGRTILRFRSVTWNQGRGPLHLFSNPPSGGTGSDLAQDVMQHIRQANGTVRNKLVGNFVWHAVHDHFHFTDVAQYTFQRVDGSGGAPTFQEKTTRCMWDTAPYNLALPGASPQRTFQYSECGGLARQGIGVGWGDIYENTLADQYIDVSTTSPGLYQLSFMIDPDVHFVEQRKDNNQSIVLLDINPQARTLRVVGSAGPFANTPVSFINDTLIRGEGDERVYVMHHNKKRWLRTEAIFSSYGHSFNNVRIFPKSIVDVIPFNNLVRAQGTQEVFALNDAGFKRHLRSPEVFASYGFTWTDIANITATEMSGYLDAHLVQRAGDSTIWWLDNGMRHRIISSTSSNARLFNGLELHVVNASDLSSYPEGPAVEGIIADIY